MDNLKIDLMIGVTRKCNFKCAHCLRGEAESGSFDINYLKSFLKNNPEVKYINNLTLTGGEPFLEVELMNSILDFLIENNIAIGYYYIATNGSTFTKEGVEFIFKLHNFVENPDCSYIKVSNSTFHQNEASRLKKWIPSSFWEVFEDNIEPEEYIEMYGFSIEDIIFEKESDAYYDILIEEGRALNRNSETGYKRKSATKVSSLEAYELLLYLNEEGLVIPEYCDLSFENQKDFETVESFSIKSFVEASLEVA
jgi:hypothetical protein